MNQQSRSIFTLPTSVWVGFLSLFNIMLLVCLPASATQIETQQSIWSPTGSLSTARSLHTATLLANGKVLVVGGINVINPCCTNTGSAELFDPATGQWSATSSPTTPRANHIAVRLLDGKVLIASGNGNPFGTILTSAELYDPDTGTWSSAGNLSVARQSPKATLLADGRALVTGGVVSGGFSNTAEIYDPATGVWSPTGTMNSARVLHSVTLLSDGRVLVAGGSAANFTPIQQGTAEIYDPATNIWTLTGELTVPRQTHTTILLANGKVLVTGGADSQQILANAELYDPATGQWSATGNLTSPRVLHTLTVLANGKVLAAAGAAANSGSVLKSAEHYDPATGNWAATAELKAARLNHTATLLSNDKVLVACGGGGSGQLASAEIYDSTTVPLQITGASVRGKKLFVEGQGFDVGALIFLNDEKQKSANDDENPTTRLVGKKAGRFIAPGQTVRLKVRNTDGTESAEFIFTRSAE
jgi:large repetitive protein